MKFIDAMIGYFAPGTAVRRLQARRALDMLSGSAGRRGYDAAHSGRRAFGRNAYATGANTEFAAAGATLRNSARELVRNNPHAKKARRVYVANLVGTGIVPEAQTGNKRRDAKIMAAFQAWQEQSDAAGLLDFYGLQAQIAGCQFDSGETLIRYRDRRLSDVPAGVAPMQLQVLEPDYLDTYRWGRPDGGPIENFVNQGIEFDPIGRRVAYYLFAEHPGETTILLRGRSASKRVPADQVGHLFPAHMGRPGQIRGLSEFSSVISRMFDLGDYDDAELLKKKIEACFAAFVTQPDGADGPLLAPSATDTSGANGAATNRLETFSPGMIEYLRPGEEVAFAAPSSGGDYQPFTVAQLHAIAAGLGVTYEDLTGDLSRVNYSSYRAGQLQFRRAIEMDQFLMFIPMVCAPVWRRFIDRLVIAGTLDAPAYGVSWTTPKFESVDPAKDAEADKLDARSGFISVPEQIRRRGYEPQKVIEETAEFLKAARAAGLVLDTDGSLTNGRGSAIPPNDAAANPAATQGKSDA